MRTRKCGCSSRDSGARRGSNPRQWVTTHALESPLPLGEASGGEGRAADIPRRSRVLLLRGVLERAAVAQFVHVLRDAPRFAREKLLDRRSKLRVGKPVRGNRLSRGEAARKLV